MKNDIQDVRYEPDERPPLALTIGLGLQYATLTVAGIVLTPAILVGAVGGGEAYLSWALFAALVVSGVTTVIQSTRIGRVGSGYLLLMGSSGAFIAVCVAALERGGGGLMASLIIVSSLCRGHCVVGTPCRARDSRGGKKILPQGRRGLSRVWQVEEGGRARFHPKFRRGSGKCGGSGGRGGQRV